MWWRSWRRRRAPVEAPAARAAEGAAARRAVVESRSALARTRVEVDEWTGEVRKLLGGSP